MGNLEIKRWDNGKVIIPAGKYASLKEAVEKEYKNLSWANLSWADLSRADLSRANLSGADLFRADLFRADLSGADLSWANLSWANLSGANLSGADLKKIPSLNTPTINEYIKKYEIEKKGEYIYVFKGVTDDLESPQLSTKIKYDKGIKSVDFADCDVWQDCSYGISVSPTKEAAKEWGTKIIKLKVHMGDIVCIPVYGHDKKFRVKKVEVVNADA